MDGHVGGRGRDRIVPLTAPLESGGIERCVCGQGVCGQGAGAVLAARVGKGTVDDYSPRTQTLPVIIL